MEMITRWVSIDGKSFNDISQCKNHEDAVIEMRKEFEAKTASGLLKKLIYDLNEVQNINPETIATCSYDCIRIKGMVRICQAFVDDHKHNLNYY